MSTYGFINLSACLQYHGKKSQRAYLICQYAYTPLRTPPNFFPLLQTTTDGLCITVLSPTTN